MRLVRRSDRARPLVHDISAERAKPSFPRSLNHCGKPSRPPFAGHILEEIFRWWHIFAAAFGSCAGELTLHSCHEIHLPATRCRSLPFLSKGDCLADLRGVQPPRLPHLRTKSKPTNRNGTKLSLLRRHRGDRHLHNRSGRSHTWLMLPATQSGTAVALSSCRSGFDG